MASQIVLDLQGLPSEQALHALRDAVYLWFKRPTVIKVKNPTSSPVPFRRAF